MNPQIVKINNLRAKAASLLENRGQSSTEAFENIKREAQSLLEMAAKLQSKYNIQESELNPALHDETIGGLSFAVPNSLRQNVRAVWFELLCQSVGNILDVRFAFSGKLAGNSCHIIGNEKDASAAFELLTSLCDKLALFFDTLKQTKEDLKKFEFALGYAHGCMLVSEAEKPRKNTEESSNTSNVLALVSLSAIAIRKQKLVLIDQTLQKLQVKPAEKRLVNTASDSYREGLHDGLNSKNIRTD
jgi:hypothetical protein